MEGTQDIAAQQRAEGTDLGSQYRLSGDHRDQECSQTGVGCADHDDTTGRHEPMVNDIILWR
jgi:hypothetical protein